MYNSVCTGIRISVNFLFDSRGVSKALEKSKYMYTIESTHKPLSWAFDKSFAFDRKNDAADV